MYVRRKIRFKLWFEDSWRFLLVVGLWGTFVVYLHDYVGVGLISVPIVPVSTIGIAVSLYLGFKSKASYERWWEGRKIWGDIINKSRGFSNKVHGMLYTSDGEEVSQTVKKELIYRHLGWLVALKYQLRQTSRFTRFTRERLFDHRAVNDEEVLDLAKYLGKEELEKVSAMSNTATQILIEQGKVLKGLAKDGYLDSVRHSNVNEYITFFYDTQGKCERIKKTPFPRPLAHFGQLFTWIFIILIPLGFLDTFADEGARYLHDAALQREYMFALVPFTMLISWIFFMIERISESFEDPFEGGMNDLPLSAMVRTIEIDLLESLGELNIPKPVQVVDDLLH